jgi:hypothetical protein
MVVKKASVTYERKFNLGDFQSLTLGAVLWADLEGDENPRASIEALQVIARDAVRAEFVRLRDRREVKADADAAADGAVSHG